MPKTVQEIRDAIDHDQQNITGKLRTLQEMMSDASTEILTDNDLSDSFETIREFQTALMGLVNPLDDDSVELHIRKLNEMLPFLEKDAKDNMSMYSWLSMKLPTYSGIDLGTALKDVFRELLPEEMNRLEVLVPQKNVEMKNEEPKLDALSEPDRVKAVDASLSPEHKEYLSSRRNFMAQSTECLSDLVRVYGPDGTIGNHMGEDVAKAYNDIHLQKPEGVSDELVAAIVIGACMDIRKHSSAASSDEYGDPVTSSKGRLFTDVMNNDPRVGDYGYILLAAKKEAAEALKEYSEGKKINFNQLLKNYTDYCISNAHQAMTSKPLNSNTRFTHDQAAFHFALNVII